MKAPKQTTKAARFVKIDPSRGYTDQDTIKATVSDRQAKLQAAQKIGRKS